MDETANVRHFLDFYLTRREDVPEAGEEEKQRVIALWERDVR